MRKDTSKTQGPSSKYQSRRRIQEAVRKILMYRQSGFSKNSYNLQPDARAKSNTLGSSGRNLDAKATGRHSYATNKVSNRIKRRVKVRTASIEEATILDLKRRLDRELVLRNYKEKREEFLKNEEFFNKGDPSKDDLDDDSSLDEVFFDD